ncbi:MFS transporter [Tropicimonas aquimaris]|uniref:MFS transporter n=1 Tax=Tropicimonas aquimaris TaxID=914152 RepID=A0ABW3ITJ2_9RHOB
MTAAQDQHEGRKAALALAALMCAVSVTVLESMAVSVTLPAIARDFAVPATASTWVMGSAQLVIVALLLPMASLGGVVGYRKVYLTSLAVFATATMACMLAPNFPALVAARGLQAIGTAGAMSLGLALLRTVCSDARLGTAIGLMATTVALASSLGPAVSGLILTVASWRAVFGLLVVMSLIALVAGSIALPRVPPSGGKFDLLGAVLVAALLTAALVVINGLANGWSATVLLSAAAIFALALVAVLARSRGAAAPVFPTDLLARPVFALSIVASICAFTAQTLGFILLPFYLLYGAGFGELQMAVTLSVWPAATAILAPLIGRFSDRFPAGHTGAAGLAVLAIGFLLISGMDATPTAASIAIPFAICGMGFAIFQTPNNRLIMLAAPRERSAAASGSVSVARQFGRAVGTAIAAFALLSGPTASIDAMAAAAAIAGLGAVASMSRTWVRRTIS